MTTYKSATTFVLTAGAAAALAAAAAPASAGGIGDILSPAFGTNCANHKPPSHAAGATTTGTGTGTGGEIQNGLVNVDDVAIRILGSGSNTDIG
ncbi:hypothetical protein ACIPY6_43065 [Streptomyces sp. NPDC090054]|uniref:hypothetical protein n=1 Tax=Streptomyces sp. NPDC090054 TaxID=3365933 RepID=UPI00380C69EB